MRQPRSVSNGSAYHARALAVFLLASNRIAFSPKLVGLPRQLISSSRHVIPLASAVEEDLATRAGAAAVEAATAAAKGQASSMKEKGRPISVTLRTKPLGVIVATNPSGRGCFINEVVPGSVADDDGRLEEGDFVTDVVGPDGTMFHVSWLRFEDVREAIERTPAPIRLKIRRGGPEPWSLERDESGLSVEEMVESSKAEYGRLIDDDQEDALRNAFAEIKEGERREAARAAATGGFDSGSLQAVSAFEYELRAFAQGARAALQQIAQKVYNRALVDAKVAVSTAEYVLRRSIFDSGRLLGTASSAISGLLGTSSSRSDTKLIGTRSSSAPFQRMLGSISERRLLTTASEADKEGIKKDAAAKKAEQDAADALEAERQARFQKEATELIGEAIRGVEMWVKETAAKDKMNARQRKDVSNNVNDSSVVDADKAVDWELLRQRASLLGGEAAQSVGEALEIAQADFEAYQQLRQQGQLPTILEQLGEPLENRKSSGTQTLSSFKNQMSPSKQRLERQQRRNSERKAKQVMVTAAIGQRASQDTADALVFGVLPPAKVVGRMIAKNIAENVATRFDPAQQKKNGKSSGRKESARDGFSLAGFVGGVAKEIAQEYATDIKRGQELGPLADIADVVKAPTSILQKDLKSVGQAIEAAATSMESAARSELAETRAKIEQLRDMDLSQALGTAATSLESSARSELEETRAQIEKIRSLENEAASKSDSPQDFAQKSVKAEEGGASEDFVETTAEDSNDRIAVEVITSDTSDSRQSSRSISDSVALTPIEENDAIDVEVLATEATPEQQKDERSAQLLDSVLLTVEVALGTLASRTVDFLTPEEARPWEVLRSFKKEDKIDQKAAEARERVLDEFAKGITRN